MRAQTKAEESIKIALAIYKGLPDSERADRLAEWRTLPGHEARTLVALCERYEFDVQADRRRTADMERQLQIMRGQLSALQANAGQPDIYDSRTDSEIKRGTFGAALVFVGIAGVWWACSEFGLATVVGGAAAIGILRFLFSRPVGNEQEDYTPQAGATAQQFKTGQTIIFNVSQNGDVNFSQQ